MTKSTLTRAARIYGGLPPKPGKKKRGRPTAAHVCPRCGATITRAQLDRKAPHVCEAKK